MHADGSRVRHMCADTSSVMYMQKKMHFSCACIESCVVSAAKLVLRGTRSSCHVHTNALHEEFQGQACPASVLQSSQRFRFLCSDSIPTERALTKSSRIVSQKEHAQTDCFNLHSTSTVTEGALTSIAQQDRRAAVFLTQHQIPPKGCTHIIQRRSQPQRIGTHRPVPEWTPPCCS